MRMRRITNAQLRELDLDAEADLPEIARKRAERTMRRRTETAAMQWTLLQAFMGRALVTRAVPNTVTIAFDNATEAEEFERFIAVGRRRTT